MKITTHATSLSKRLAFTTIILALVFACTTQNSPEPQSVTKLQDGMLSLDDAAKIAGSFSPVVGEKKDLKNARFVGEAKKVKNTSTVKDENGALFYIFNYEGTGFLILCASEDYFPVLAFSADNSFPTQNQPQPIKDYIETTKNRIKKAKEKPKDLPLEDIQKAWVYLKKDANLPFNTPSKNGRMMISSCEGFSRNVIVSPMLQTNWGQSEAGANCEYNIFVPETPNCSGNCADRAPTGCNATAMAQIMRKWQHPNSYAWGNMSNNQGGIDVSLLMANAGQAVGTVYQCNISTAYPNQIAAALKNNFGYGSANYESSVSFSRIINDLNQGEPCFLGGYGSGGGVGHAWVCDGYAADTDDCGYSTYYTHMNWGWDGFANGYYHFSSWTPSGTSYNFSYYKNGTFDIHP